MSTKNDPSVEADRLNAIIRSIAEIARVDDMFLAVLPTAYGADPDSLSETEEWLCKLESALAQCRSVIRAWEITSLDDAKSRRLTIGHSIGRAGQAAIRAHRELKLRHHGLPESFVQSIEDLGDVHEEVSLFLQMEPETFHLRSSPTIPMADFESKLNAFANECPGAEDVVDWAVFIRLAILILVGIGIALLVFRFG